MFQVACSPDESLNDILYVIFIRRDARGEVLQHSYSHGRTFDGSELGLSWFDQPEADTRLNVLCDIFNVICLISDIIYNKM